MFKPKAMAKVRITGVNSGIKPVIEALFDLKMLHLVDFEKGHAGVLDFGKPLAGADEYSDFIVKAGSIVSHYHLKGEAEQVENFSSSKHKFLRLFSDFSSAATEISSLNETRKSLQGRLLEPMARLFVPQKFLREYSRLSVFKGIAKKSARPALNVSGIPFEGTERKVGNDFAMVLFVAKRDEQAAREILSVIGFSEQELPENFSESSLRNGLALKERKIAEKQAIIESIGKNNSRFLLDFAFSVKRLNEIAETPLRFGSTKNAFVATGWVLQEKAGALKARLGRFEGGVSVEFSDSKAGAPIALDNPKVVQPFEFFLDLYTFPRYGEIDPSIIVFITFPLFFGFMLGDVGYGIVSLALFAFLAKNMKGKAKTLPLILMWASIASIIFGFVFAEFFGWEFMHPLIPRAHEPTLMLGIAVLVGAIHLNLGLLIGFYNELNSHGFKHAFFAKISWIVLQAGVALLALDGTGIMKIGFVPGMVLVLAAVAMLYLGEGAKGIVELPAIFSNMLSYARLFAVGLSSVSIALVVNQIAGSLMPLGPIGWVGVVAVLLIGHTLNLGLGILGPGLHSLRLHYVEFFSKFFHGGGKKFSPFGAED